MAIASPRDKFFAVLNKHLADNSYPTIDPAEYEMGAPANYAGSAYPRNTRLVLDPPLSSPSAGRTTVYYDRIDFATVTNIVVPKGSAVTVNDLLPTINEELGIALASTDIISENLPTNGTFPLKASTTNLIYKGQATITLA